MLRMAKRRFTRLTNGFSRKLENHIAAVGLHVGWYNFRGVHDAPWVTLAMQLGVSDHIWTNGELVNAVLLRVPLADWRIARWAAALS